jgi:YspA, cpYpsA-related SLOG family
MKVIVCGGRDYPSPSHVFAGLDDLHAERPISELMQGGATGVDQFARDWAIYNGVKRWVCHADWKTHGKAAGPMRNQRMLEWKPDVVVAFPGGRGTADMVRRARDTGIEVIELPRPLSRP